MVFQDGQSSTDERPDPTRSRGSETTGSETTVGHSGHRTPSVERSKKFVCQDCSTVKYKNQQTTGTKCPECGKKMTSARPSREEKPSGGEKFTGRGKPSGVWKCPTCGSVKYRGEGTVGTACRSCSRKMIFQGEMSAAEFSRREASSSDTQSDSPGEGCFIATTVYGNYDHPDVRRLRRFRDETLRHTAWGRAFIAWYYRYGPTLAGHLEGHHYLKKATRWVLKQTVTMWLR